MQIIGVFHADAGIIGELKYIGGSILGLTECALCNMTHKWNPLGSKEWRNEKRKWGNLKAIHRNHQPEAMAQVTKHKTPCVLLENENNFIIIMSSEEIETCNGDLQELLARIRFKLAKKTLN